MKHPITKEGFNKLEQELWYLKYTEMPKISEAIQKAREHGDLSENAEYQFAKEHQKLVSSKITTITSKLSESEIIEILDKSSKIIGFGATVKLKDLNNNKVISYTIVGKYESDIKNNTISILSPLAKSMLHKTEKEFISLNKLDGSSIKYEILSVTYE